MSTFTRLDTKILVSVLIAVLVSWLIPSISVLPAVFAALLCVQDEQKGTYKAGLNRLLATVIGGVFGVLITILVNIWSSKIFIFIALAFAVSLTLWVSKVAKLPPFIARISVLTFFLVVFIGQGQSMHYILERLVATLFGAFIAWGVSASLSKW
ncbi:aluminum activated malate transporter family protein [Streptococcus sciuri]|uniref:Aluminum activated malate transporter family protein n=1 Tax=Streptococcus sciuri TaxID=2973939 RepID=A0ABT2F7A7_9STRE|nr:aluminum activated malate transporter family protein [Streptococcus sciuri]MCS4487725.1 aluminum activated malate transporter family protein [Streptococcus sciuri]